MKNPEKTETSTTCEAEELQNPKVCILRKKFEKSSEYKHFINTIEHIRFVAVVAWVVPNLAHAWVVSFVSSEALVDLFSQSSVLFWSP